MKMMIQQTRTKAETIIPIMKILISTMVILKEVLIIGNQIDLMADFRTEALDFQVTRTHNLGNVMCLLI